MVNKPSKIIYSYERQWKLPKRGSNEYYVFKIIEAELREMFSYEELSNFVRSTKFSSKPNEWRVILFQEHTEKQLYQHVVKHLGQAIFTYILKGPIEAMPLYINGIDSMNKESIPKYKSEFVASIAGWRLKRGV